MKITYEDTEILLEGDNVEKIWEKSRDIVSSITDKLEDEHSKKEAIAHLFCINAVINTSLTKVLHNTLNSEEEIIEFIKSIFE